MRRMKNPWFENLSHGGGYKFRKSLIFFEFEIVSDVKRGERTMFFYTTSNFEFCYHEHIYTEYANNNSIV